MPIRTPGHARVGLARLHQQVLVGDREVEAGVDQVAGAGRGRERQGRGEREDRGGEAEEGAGHHRRPRISGSSARDARLVLVTEETRGAVAPHWPHPSGAAAVDVLDAARAQDPVAVGLRRIARREVRQVPQRADDLGDRLAGGGQRVEARHGVLEGDGEVAAAAEVDGELAVPGPVGLVVGADAGVLDPHQRRLERLQLQRVGVVVKLQVRVVPAEAAGGDRAGEGPRDDDRLRPGRGAARRRRCLARPAACAPRPGTASARSSCPSWSQVP